MKVKNKIFIKLGLLLFVGFAVYVGHKSFFDQIPEKIKSAITIPEATEEEKTVITSFEPDELKLKFSTNDDKSFIGNSISSILNKILDHPNGRLIVKDVLQKMVRQSNEVLGHDLFLSRYLVYDIAQVTGKQATCGDMVEISYKIVSEDGKNEKEKQEELKTTITIGNGAVGINFENGIIGMGEGGERRVVYPGGMSQQGEMKSIIAIVKLLSIKKGLEVNKKLGRPFFEKIEEKYSSGIRLICGDVVKGSYSLTDLKGKTLYDSKNSGKDFSFRIGEDTIPLEVSNAIIGLPAQKASVSFITSPGTAMDSFSKLKDFIPKPSTKESYNDPAILTFNLVSKEKHNAKIN